MNDRLSSAVANFYMAPNHETPRNAFVFFSLKRVEMTCLPCVEMGGNDWDCLNITKRRILINSQKNGSIVCQRILFNKTRDESDQHRDRRHRRHLRRRRRHHLLLHLRLPPPRRKIVLDANVLDLVLSLLSITNNILIFDLVLHLPCPSLPAAILLHRGNIFLSPSPPSFSPSVIRRN